MLLIVDQPVLRLVLLTAVGALSSCAPPLDEQQPVPDVVVAARGAGQGPRLVAVQAYLRASDYATEQRFAARLGALLDDAEERGLLDARTVVVLPEYVGSWLVGVDESPAMFDEGKGIGGAIAELALAHLPSFLARSLGADVDDGNAFAAFSEKAERMAEVYHRVMGELARAHEVTLVAGSILLPAPRLVRGRLAVTPGAALHNTSVVYGADGGALAISHKAFLTADEQAFAAAADVDDIAVIDTPAGRLGVLVCADSWYPQSYRRLVDEGAELLAVPTFHSGHDVWDAPWQGYSGHALPDDVDEDDVGALTESQAWDKYALAGRAIDAGVRAAVSAPLRGELWDLGDEGQAFLVDTDGFERAPDVDAPGLFSLQLP